METDRIKWNQRFASQESLLGMQASPFLRQEIARIVQMAPGRHALDLACGEGRNSIFLAQQGFQVTGLDISDIGISKAKDLAEAAGVAVNFERVDLEGYCIPCNYDLIINFNFLLRELIPAMVQALTPGGLLLFDTIMASPQLLAAHNPAYLLQQGELKGIFEALEGDLLFTEENSSTQIPTARVLFQKRLKEL